MIHEEQFRFQVGPFHYRVSILWETPTLPGDRLTVGWALTGIDDYSAVGSKWRGATRGYGLGKDSRYTFKTLATLVSVIREQVDRHRPDFLMFRFVGRSHDRFWEKFLRYVVPGFVVEDDLTVQENGVWTISLDGYYRNSV